MKKVILLGVFLLTLLTATASAQDYNRTERRVSVSSGKKLILKGAVRDTDEIAYVFSARGGQRLSVKVNGRDADFSVLTIDDFDVLVLAEDVKTWSGTLAGRGAKKVEIMVHSNYKVADYQLEILLK